MSGDGKPAEHLRVVAEIERELSALRKRPTTLDEFIGLWDRFVAEVENEYGSGIYEYANYLSVRDHLASILAKHPASRPVIEPHLSEIDERYTRSTKESGHPIMRLGGLTPDRWWWYRWPLRYGPELAEDLKREHDHDTN